MGSAPLLNLDPEDNINLDKLINKISLQQCCAFIGAGLSICAGYPSWDGVIKHFEHKIQGLNIDPISLPVDSNWNQIEFFRKVLGEEKYKDEIVYLFGQDGKHQFLPAHHKLCQIPFPSLITTNFDYCLENAAMSCQKNITVQYYPELNFSLFRESQIYHIHGVIPPLQPQALIGSIILSESDYSAAYQQGTGLPRFLASVADFYSIVFLGYSLGDNDLIKVIHATQLELEQRSDFESQRKLGKRKQPPHFIIMHKDAKVNRDKLSHLGLLPIRYGGEKVRHADLQILLDYIQSRTTQIKYPEPTIYRDIFEE
jgi:hypothetical protein